MMHGGQTQPGVSPTKHLVGIWLITLTSVLCIYIQSSLRGRLVFLAIMYIFMSADVIYIVYIILIFLIFLLVSQQASHSPGTARKQQAKLDHALFWSIINNTPRPSNVGTSR